MEKSDFKKNYYKELIVEQEIQKLDKSYRKKLLLIYLYSLLFIFALFFLGKPVVEVIFNNQTIINRFYIMETSLILFLICFNIPAIYLITLGKKIIKFKQFPLPNMKVIKDTIILKDAAAIKRGKALIHLGYLSFIMSILGSAAIHYSFASFKNAPLLKQLFVSML